MKNLKSFPLIYTACMLTCLFWMSGCVKTSSGLDVADVNRLDHDIQKLVDQALANQNFGRNMVPAAVVPGSLKKGSEFNRLEEIIISDMTKSLRRHHTMFELSRQNWFEYRAGRPLTFKQESRGQQVLLQDMILYEVHLSADTMRDKLDVSLVAMDVNGKNIPGISANMDLAFGPQSTEYALYHAEVHQTPLPKGLEETPFTSYDNLAYSLAAELVDGYRNSVNAADSEVTVVLTTNSGRNVSAQETKEIQQGLQQAIISQAGFTCAISKNDLRPAFKQINFYNRNQQVFDLDKELFQPGTVLLIVDATKHRDFDKTGIALRSVWRVTPLENKTGGLIRTNLAGTYLSGFTAKAYIESSRFGYGGNGNTDYTEPLQMDSIDPKPPVHGQPVNYDIIHHGGNPGYE